MEKGFYNVNAILLAVTLQCLTVVGCSTSDPQNIVASKAGARTAQASLPTKTVKAATDRPASSLDAHRQGKSAAAGPLKDIFFDFDQYALRGDARDALKFHAGWLKTNSSAQVEIEGHCDERGTGEYNLALGAKRAQSAKDYLVALGVRAARISTISYGKELQVCHEPTEACWQRNRHDRFVLKELPIN